MSNQSSSVSITSDEKLWAVLGYILSPWISIIVILFVKDKTENSKFLHHHLMQALGWGAIWLILSILAIGLCLYPIVFIIDIYFAYKAYQGEMFTIPVVTDFMVKQGWM
jgi:uncharacterized protein